HGEAVERRVVSVRVRVEGGVFEAGAGRLPEVEALGPAASLLNDGANGLGAEVENLRQVGRQVEDAVERRAGGRLAGRDVQAAQGGAHVGPQVDEARDLEVQLVVALQNPARPRVEGHVDAVRVHGDGVGRGGGH